jgi:adenylate cyclase
MAKSQRVRSEEPLQAIVTVRGVILLQLLANGAGAVVVFVYLQFLFPVRTPEDERQLGINLVVFGAYLLLTLTFAYPLNKLFLTRAMRWVHEGREPTRVERTRILTQPLQQTVSAFIGWIGAAIIFGLLNEDAKRVAMGIVLAGLVTCAMLYLLLERHFRPVFALALKGAELPRTHREILPRIMMAWLLGSAVPIIGLGLAPISVPADQRSELSARLAVLVVTSVIAGGLVMRAAARAVAHPVEQVRAAMAEVEEGELDTEVPVDHAGELGRLQAGFNSMVEGLRERRRIHDLFGRQVGVDVARQALERDPELGGEEREVTALFVDLAGFTAFAESHEPSEVVQLLNDFYSVVVRVVMDAGGFVNKFEGDAALCVFGAPGVLEDHAACALCAAAALPGEVAALPRAPGVGIGVATGVAVAGNIGTTERFEYTIIGDPVNIAARLTELAKDRDCRVLATEETVVAAGEAGGRWERTGWVRLRGRSGETGLFEPVA